MLEGPVGHHHGGGTGPDDLGHGQRSHRTRADDHDVAAFQPVDVVGCALECGADQARGDAVDVGLRVGALADAQGLLEQHVERRTDGAGLLPHPQRLPRLAEDLALPEDHRVQARGDVEQVRDGAVVVVHVEVAEDLLGPQAGTLAHQHRQRLDTAVEAVDVGVHLGAVAGGEHRRLGDVLELGDLAHHLLGGLGVQGHPLEHRDRCGLVGDAHDQDAHAVSPTSSRRAAVDLRCSW